MTEPSKSVANPWAVIGRKSRFGGTLWPALVAVTCLFFACPACCKSKPDNPAVEEAISNVDTKLPAGKVDLLEVDVTKDDDFHSKKAGILGVYVGMPIEEARNTLKKNDLFIVNDKKVNWTSFKFIDVFAKKDGKQGDQLIEIEYNPEHKAPDVMQIRISFQLVPFVEGPLGEVFTENGYANIKDWLGSHKELSDRKDSWIRVHDKRGLLISASGTKDNPNGSIVLQR